MKRKWMLVAAMVLVVAMILSLPLTGCKTTTTTAAAETTAAATAATGELYVEASALGNLDYFYDHKMGMEQVGKDLGVKTEYVGPADYNIAEMINAMEQVIAKKPVGLVVVGFEDTLVPIVNKVVEQGIPVVTVDADLPTSKRIAFVGTGNYNAGFQGGTKLAELIGEKGKVAIMTKPGQSNLEERINGYKDALAKFPDIQIVQIADTQSDAVVAAQAAASLIQKYPDLAGIGCVEAAGGAGAATAIKEASKVGQIKVVSMDRGGDTLQAIADEVISATVVQQTALMPYYAVQILYNLKHANIQISSDNAKAGVSGTPAVIDTGIIMVDKNNYQYFVRK